MAQAELESSPFSQSSACTSEPGGQNGVCASLPGVAEIRAMRSFRKLDMQVRPGGFVSRTTDCFTRPGSVQLVHEDEAIVLADHARIRALEGAGLFEFAG